MGISIRQLNAGKRDGALAAATCLVSSSTKPKVILLQEPFKAGLKYGKTFKAQTGQRQRAAIYVDENFASISGCHLLTEFTDRDQVAVSLKIEVTKDLTMNAILCSVYLPSDVSHRAMLTDKLRNLIAYCQSSKTELLIGCDANAHNMGWGSRKTNARGETLMDFIIEKNLRIVNKGDNPTYLPDISNPNGKNSVIDLTIATDKIERVLSNWRVLDEDSHSDHRWISWELSAEIPQIAKYRNKRKTDWKMFIQGLNELEKLTDIDPEMSISELEALASQINLTLLESYKKACKERKRFVICKHPWYTAELHEIKKKLRKNFKMAYQLKTEEGWDMYKKLRNEYHRKCKKNRHRGWRNFAEKLDNIKDVARMQKFFENGASKQVASLRNPTTPTLKTLMKLLQS